MNLSLKVQIHPITFKADKILEEKDEITVIPDIVAGLGSAVISYFEWVQDLSQLRWTATRVSKRTREGYSEFI